MGFKICSVGCGYIAETMHGPSYLKYSAENPDAVFSGCCDIDAAKAEAFREKFGFLSAYTDMDEMLKKEKPDAVCLISPVELTPSLAEKVLNLGIPLILEKPPGRTLDEVSRLIDLAEKRGTPNRVAFNRRYAPLMRRLRQEIKGGIQSIQYDMFRVRRLDIDFATTAIHAIDGARFISGADYRSIRFSYREYPELSKNVADMYLSCEMKNGASMQINICPVTGILAERAAVQQLDRTYMMDLLGNPLTPSGRLLSLHKNEIQFDIPGDKTGDGGAPFEREGFYYENKSFFDDIIAGRKPSGDLTTALQSVQVADLIRNRAREIYFD